MNCEFLFYEPRITIGLDVVFKSSRQLKLYQVKYYLNRPKDTELYYAVTN